MHRLFRTAASALALTLLGSGISASNETCQSDALLVFDGSGSMSETGFNQLDEPRIHMARRAIAKAMPQIAAYRKIGLLTYGAAGEENACNTIDLKFPPISNAAPRVIAEIEALQPAGDTALTEGVRQAAEALNFRTEAATVVLLTDGKETCGGEPCALAGDLLAEGRDLTVHVIGFKVRGQFFSWDSQGREEYINGTTVARCLADRLGKLIHGLGRDIKPAGAISKTAGDCGAVDVFFP
ncbi:MAG: VWA domain-containing protein, partial [Pseudomonadota bacterium]